MTRKTKNRLQRARRSPVVLLVALGPVLTAALPAAQDALPLLREVVSPLVYFGLSVAVSAVVIGLHLRDTDKGEE